LVDLLLTLAESIRTGGHRIDKLQLRANPAAGSFVRLRRAPDGRLDREELRIAIQYGFRIVRWHLDGA
jgi:hypothetical protein